MGRVISQLVHELLEHTATMLVIFELIEAGASRREQNDIAGLRGPRSNFDGALDRSRAFDGDASLNLLFDFFGRGTDEQCKDRLLAKRGLQNRVVAALVFPAENNKNAAGKSVERLERRVDVGRFRIVVIADAVVLRYTLEPMFDTSERADSFCNFFRLCPREPRCSNGG